MQKPLFTEDANREVQQVQVQVQVLVMILGATQGKCIVRQRGKDLL